MSTEKEVTIQFIKEDNPELYKKLKKSGDLNRLSADELLHIHASSATEYEDVSDISDDEIEPVNMTVIDNVIKQVQNKKSHKPKFYLIINKLAIAASVLICLGLLITNLTESQGTITFVDNTSQETTDYEIRVHSDETSTEIFQDDFFENLKLIINQYASNLSEDIICTTLPVVERGDAVIIKLSTNEKSETALITLTDKNDVNKQLISVLPEMITKLTK